MIYYHLALYPYENVAHAMIFDANTIIIIQEMMQYMFPTSTRVDFNSFSHLAVPCYCFRFEFLYTVHMTFY